MANILVTGASGFIGSWVLRKLLANNHNVVALDQVSGHQLWNKVCGNLADRIKFDSTQLSDPESLSQLIGSESIDHIIHLAALLTPACQSNPWLGFQSNVVGSIAIFEAAKRSGRIQSISYTSSYAVYGNASESPPTFYGAFKQSVDLVAEQYWLHESIPSVGIRPHIVYGPERETGLTAGPSLAAKAIAMNVSYVFEYSGMAGYDYVEDVADALIRSVLNCPANATLIDMRSQTAEPEDFIAALEKVVAGAGNLISVDGPRIPVNIPPRPNFIDFVFSDFNTTSLENGIRKTVEYYLS